MGWLTNIGAVDEAEQVEKRDGWNDIEIDLQPQSRLSLRIERDKRMPVSVHH